MEALLGRESLVVRKKSNKSKLGYTEVDLIPQIRSWRLECQSDTMTVDLVLSAQNPGLNPELIRAAFCEAYPDLAPDFVTFHRRRPWTGTGTFSDKTKDSAPPEYHPAGRRISLGRGEQAVHRGPQGPGQGEGQGEGGVVLVVLDGVDGLAGDAALLC